MILTIDGKLKPYYAQTLAMIFFPGAKFPENEELTPETVAEAIRTLHPYAVDVSSGIETEGVKDSGKMRRFVENAMDK